MAKGWISVHRQLQQHWLWEDKPFSKGQAWIDLLLSANHCNKKFLLGNELVEVKAGSFITSELKLMERWGWGKSKTRAFLDLLQSEGMIKKISDQKKTTIIIENYSVYQGEQTTNRPQTDHNQTAGRPQTDTNNNENNDNNENNESEKHRYGEHQNVLLTDEELEKLQGKYTDWEDKIEYLSSYMASKGKSYENHYATIMNWAIKDAKKQNKEQKGRLDWIDDL